MESEIFETVIGTVLPIALLVIGIPSTLLRRRRYGRVLVRLGHFAPHWLSLASGVGIAIMSLLLWNTWGGFHLMSLSAGAILGFIGLLPLELRERGIVSRDNAYRWSQLLEYRWAGSNGRLLELHFRSRWWPTRVGFVPLSPDQRERVDRILEEYSPADQLGR